MANARQTLPSSTGQRRFWARFGRSIRLATIGLPKPIDFGAAVSVKFAGKESADTPGAKNVIIDVGPMSDFRMQVQTILYDNAKITWASPRKSPAWPLRIHAGKCELGPRTLLIFVYEMQAKNPIPNYQEGPIAAIAGALRPL